MSLPLRPPFERRCYQQNEAVPAITFTLPDNTMPKLNYFCCARWGIMPLLALVIASVFSPMAIAQSVTYSDYTERTIEHTGGDLVMLLVTRWETDDAPMNSAPGSAMLYQGDTRIGYISMTHYRTQGPDATVSIGVVKNVSGIVHTWCRVPNENTPAMGNTRAEWVVPSLPAGTYRLFVRGATTGDRVLRATSVWTTTRLTSASSGLVPTDPAPKLNQVIQFTPPGARQYGDTFTLIATADSGLPVSFTLEAGPATLSGATVHLTDTGVVSITATQDGDMNWNPAPPVTVTFNALPRDIVVTPTVAGKTFDGTTAAHVTGWSLSGAVPGDDVSVSGTAEFAQSASGENVSVVVAASLDGAHAARYAMAVGPVSADITRKALQVIAASASKVFDGSALAIPDPSVVGLVPADTATGFTRTLQVGPDTGTFSTSVSELTTSLGASNYEVSFVSGSAEITPYGGLVRIVSASPRKTFDGTMLAVPAPSAHGLLAGDSLISFEGTTQVGPQAGDYPTKVISAQTSWGLSNYSNVQFIDGVASIDRSAAPVVVTAASPRKAFDGTRLAIPPPTVTGLVAGDSLIAFTGTAETHHSAGTYETSVTEIETSLGVENYSNVSYVQGTATIDRAALSVTGQSPSKSFDGTPLPVASPLVVGLAPSDSVTDATFTPAVGPEAGTYSTSVTAIQTSLGVQNYDVSFAAGEARIQKKSVFVTAENKSRPLNRPNPALTYDIEGFIAGDEFLHVGIPSLSTPAVPNVSLPGAYPITVDVGAMSAENYSFHGVDGVLTVTEHVPDPSASISATALGEWPSQRHGQSRVSVSWNSQDLTSPFIYVRDNDSGAIRSLSAIAAGSLNVDLVPGSYSFGIASPNLPADPSHEQQVTVYYRPNFWLSATVPYVLYAGPTNVSVFASDGPLVSDYLWSINGSAPIVEGPNFFAPVTDGNIGRLTVTASLPAAPESPEYRLASQNASLELTVCRADLQVVPPQDLAVPVDITVNWGTLNVSNSVLRFYRVSDGANVFAPLREGVDPEFAAGTKTQRVIDEGSYRVELEFTLPDGSVGSRTTELTLLPPRGTGLRMGAGAQTVIQDKANRGKSSFVSDKSERKKDK